MTKAQLRKKAKQTAIKEGNNDQSLAQPIMESGPEED
jgi:hypothetical protein